MIAADKVRGILTEASVDVAFSSFTSPYIAVYSWSDIDGFGSKYSDPGTAIAGVCYDVDFSPASDAIITAHSTTPYTSAYPWSSAGFGAKYSDPASLPGSGSNNPEGVRFSPDGNDVVFGSRQTPYIHAYAWSAGFGSKYSDPATTPPSYQGSVEFSPDGADIVFGSGSGNTPEVVAYAWSSGFGAKYSDPASLPTGIVGPCKWSPDGNTLFVPDSISPYIHAYSWSSGFGAKFGNPGTLPTGAGNAVDTKAGIVVVGHTASPYVTAYTVSSSAFTSKLSDPSTLPSGNCFGVRFSPSGSAIFVSSATTPYTQAYEWSDSTGFGSKYSDPSTLHGGQVRRIAVTSYAVA